MAQSTLDKISAPLLQRAQRGEESAVRECLAKYGGLVWSLARRLSPSAADAEDAVQEIFLDVWKSAERFDPAQSSEATFIAMIARRRLIDRKRRRDSRPSTLPIAEGQALPALEPVGELFAEAALAHKALRKLRPEQQQVLTLSIGHGLTYEEIAESTGMPLGTVKAHARRGLLQLRAELLGEAPLSEALS
jgi:RNA polymerase sigma-70 factor (ECF subfamily)